MRNTCHREVVVNPPGTATNVPRGGGEFRSMRFAGDVNIFVGPPPLRYQSTPADREMRHHSATVATNAPMARRGLYRLPTGLRARCFLSCSNAHAIDARHTNHICVFHYFVFKLFVFFFVRFFSMRYISCSALLHVVRTINKRLWHINEQLSWGSGVIFFLLTIS